MIIERNSFENFKIPKKNVPPTKSPLCVGDACIMITTLSEWDTLRK